jgi:nitrate reductase gamma subunit
MGPPVPTVSCRFLVERQLSFHYGVLLCLLFFHHETRDPTSIHAQLLPGTATYYPILVSLVIFLHVFE